MNNSVIARAFPAFAIGFALFYAPAYSFTGGNSTFSWPLFTYFPSVGDYGELHWLLVPGSDTLGPPMWWYGWIASATFVGLVFAIIAMLLPGKAIERILASLVWIVPILAFVFLANWERAWFNF